MITRENKAEIINKFKINANDTGSIEVQVALLTARINDLNQHLTVNPKDVASKFGMQKLVGQRRSFLSYLQKNNLAKYEEVIASLGLRK